MLNMDFYLLFPSQFYFSSMIFTRNFRYIDLMDPLIIQTRGGTITEGRDLSPI